MANRLNEILEKVWSAAKEVEDIDFDQDGEDIKHDLLGYHHQFHNRNGVMDKINNCLQELQTVVDEYKSIEDEIGIDLVTKDRIEKAQTLYHIDFGYEDIENVNRSNVFTGRYDLSGNEIVYPFNQYGKTWAITKEELEG